MDTPFPPTRPAARREALACLQRLEGREPPSIAAALADLSPDLADLAIDFVYGEIYRRPGLTLKERQIVTVAVLAVLGHARPQLDFHIGGALNAGCSSAEIVELMLHLVVYAGFPCGLNGVFAARDVFAARGIAHVPPAAADAPREPDARYRAGWEALQAIDGNAGRQVVDALADVAPDLARFVVEFAFGDVYTRPGLGLVERELATVAALAAMGTAAPQLRVHVHGLLNVGGSPEQLTEALIQVAPYAGFPAALNAMAVAKEVLAQR